jgi:hypothetical protein
MERSSLTKPTTELEFKSRCRSIMIGDSNGNAFANGSEFGMLECEATDHASQMFRQIDLDLKVSLFGR